jgi:hypothetical protein
LGIFHFIALSPYILSKKIKKQRKYYADKDRGSEGKIEGKPLLLDDDITGQSS